MALNPALLQEIQVLLHSCASISPSSSAAGADIYEAYVWAVAIDAASRVGASVVYRNRQGQITTNLFFRASPGRIGAASPAYTYAELLFPDCPILEAHIGIYVSGKSGVAHECDVAVLHKEEADRCRADQTLNPRGSSVELAAECKFYPESRAGINLARSFLGLVKDIQPYFRFFVCSRRADRIKKLLHRHHQWYELDVVPTNQTSQNRLRALFENTFVQFKARYL